MCGGDLPETQMGKLVFTILEETPTILVDEKGNLLNCSAEVIAKELDTTPQVVGKVMKYCDDFWQGKIVKGKTTYVPIRS